MFNKIDEIKEKIQIAAGKQNKYLHRWQTNQGRFRKTISYAIVDEKEKPPKSPSYINDTSFSVSSEGVTEKCDLYTKLQKMLNAIEAK